MTIPEAGSMPTVTFFDPIRGRDWNYGIEQEVLAPHGVRLVVPPTDEEADAAIQNADVVVVSGIRRLLAPQIASLGRAVGILCYSIGMDKVDGAAAEARGIPVRNVPGYCSDEVADHALTLLLAAWRRLVPLARRTREGSWNTAQDPDLPAIRRMRGSTLGIVGAGRIGRGVARRARGFGFRTIASDPFVEPGSDPELDILPLPEVLAQADGLILCAALTSDNRHLIDRAALALVRPGLVLVNVARGGLVDETALAEALADGRVATAALDVRDPEPPHPGADPLAGFDNLVLTPHIAATSQQAVEDLHRMAAEISLELLRDGGRLAASPDADPAPSAVAGSAR
jgi:D-3-phosphoglycerate dehydrogenase